MQPPLMAPDSGSAETRRFPLRRLLIVLAAIAFGAAAVWFISLPDPAVAEQERKEAAEADEFLRSSELLSRHLPEYLDTHGLKDLSELYHGGPVIYGKAVIINRSSDEQSCNDCQEAAEAGVVYTRQGCPAVGLAHQLQRPDRLSRLRAAFRCEQALSAIAFSGFPTYRRATSPERVDTVVLLDWQRKNGVYTQWLGGVPDHAVSVPECTITVIDRARKAIVFRSLFQGDVPEHVQVLKNGDVFGSERVGATSLVVSEYLRNLCAPL